MMTKLSEGGTDVAALSAAAVSAAITILATPGPFVATNALVGITLFFIILGYVWPHRSRTKIQSLAVAASLGLALMPTLGFAMEEYLSYQSVTQFSPVGPLAGPSASRSEGNEESRVPLFYLCYAWLSVFLFFGITDMFFRDSNIVAGSEP